MRASTGASKLTHKNEHKQTSRHAREQLSEHLSKPNYVGLEGRDQEWFADCVGNDGPNGKPRRKLPKGGRLISNSQSIRASTIVRADFVDAEQDGKVPHKMCRSDVSVGWPKRVNRFETNQSLSILSAAHPGK